jgi:hypothetical protein
MLMRSFLTILFAFVLVGYMASLFMEPGEEFSTLGWIAFMSFGVLVLFIAVFSLGAKTSSR